MSSNYEKNGVENGDDEDEEEDDDYDQEDEEDYCTYCLGRSKLSIDYYGEEEKDEDEGNGNQGIIIGGGTIGNGRFRANSESGCYFDDDDDQFYYSVSSRLGVTVNSESGLCNIYVYISGEKEIEEQDEHDDGYYYCSDEADFNCCRLDEFLFNRNCNAILTFGDGLTTFGELGTVFETTPSIVNSLMGNVEAFWNCGLQSNVGGYSFVNDIAVSDLETLGIIGTLTLFVLEDTFATDVGVVSTTSEDTGV
ncbi:MAG: hypothetical protein EZS28_037390, partial [Streblomastix strix]